MKNTAKKTTVKKSKGYRLRLSTHNLINKLQAMLQCSQDEAVTRACASFYKVIRTKSLPAKK